MTRSLPLAALVCLMAGAALAQVPGRSGARFDESCRPPLKYAAGACVSECPGGYEDRGRTCEYRNQSGSR